MRRWNTNEVEMATSGYEEAERNMVIEGLEKNGEVLMLLKDSLKVKSYGIFESKTFLIG